MNAELASFVRTHDRDRYLATLFAPDDKRDALLALYAFNCEITRIRDVVSDPQIGMIRLQWWRDTIAAIETSDHPTAKALSTAITAHNLPKQPLLNLIDAHEFDLFADPMPSLTALEGYLGETESAIIQLACLILDPEAAQGAGEVAGLAGVAHGIARHLTNSSRQTNLTPKGETASSLSVLGEKRLAEAEQKTVPKSLLPAFLHTASTRAMLRSQKPLSNLRRQWNLWCMARRGNFL